MTKIVDARVLCDPGGFPCPIPGTSNVFERLTLEFPRKHPARVLLLAPLKLGDQHPNRQFRQRTDAQVPALRVIGGEGGEAEVGLTLIIVPP